MNNNTDIKINDRVLSDDGYFGTVLYIGDVDGFQGVWYGIAWDDPTRGKHRGTIKQRTYFQCPYQSSSASFMKLDKLIKGTYFMEQIINKYTEKLDSYDDIYVMSNLNNKVSIEMVGMEKVRERQKHISSLESIMANGLKIAYIDREPLIHSYLSTNLKELNLSNNLISNWNDIVRLLKQVPKLEVLSLCDNRLSYNQNEIMSNLNTNNNDNTSNDDENNNNNSKGFSNIKTLVLNNTKTSWNSITSFLVQLFPSLTTLGLYNNEIDQISIPDSIKPLFKHLENLDISYNLLESPYDIIELSKIENLNILNLNGNKFKSIEIPLESMIESEDESTDRQTTLFSKLTTLFISNNLIDNTNSIDALDSFKSLVHLTFRDNPLVDMFYSKSTLSSSLNKINNNNNNNNNINKNTIENERITLNRLNIIPRISKLEDLNLTNITSLERKDAERYFINEFGNENTTHKMNYLKRKNDL